MFRGFYVAGSYAEGTPLPNSDIDLVPNLRAPARDGLIAPRFIPSNQ